MRIGIVHSGVIPARTYGGTERVIWGLGKALAEMGHDVTYFVKEGSSCPFTNVVFLDFPIEQPDRLCDGLDLIHFQFDPKLEGELPIPHLVTIHGNSRDHRSYDINSVFVSEDHASRHGSSAYVHNGLDWEDYGSVNLNKSGYRAHFLAKAAWKVKNVKGAIDVITYAKGWRLDVLGGHRLNLNMGFRFTITPKVNFHGMVGGEKKQQLIRSSRALIFPVRWSEPFGLAIIESLYHGCAVFGTPYGSLPELVPRDVGLLSTDRQTLSDGLQDIDSFRPERCHAYARDVFDHRTMAASYVQYYEQILGGETINSNPPSLTDIPEKYLDWS